MAKNPSATAGLPGVASVRRRLGLFSLSYVAVFLGLAAAYISITLTHPPTQTVLQQYHLTRLSYDWLLASIFAILAIIWFTSLYGSLVFKSYSHLIRQSKDGGALNTVSNGLLVLAMAEPIGLFISSLNTVITAHHTGFLPRLTIINNYIGLFLMGVSMILIAIGGEYIYRQAKYKAHWIANRIWIVCFIIISAAYSYFVVIQPIHNPAERKAYFLPDWLVVFSIAIPYVIVWYLGLNSAYQIARFQQNIRGLLYRSALKYLAAGLAAVVISSIATRLITTVSPRLNHLSLTPLLFIIYALLIIDAAGFILIAIGAKRLRKLEIV